MVTPTHPKRRGRPNRTLRQAKAAADRGREYFVNWYRSLKRPQRRRLFQAIFKIKKGGGEKS